MKETGPQNIQSYSEKRERERETDWDRERKRVRAETAKHDHDPVQSFSHWIRVYNVMYMVTNLNGMCKASRLYVESIYVVTYIFASNTTP
jgi:hypothetical protein